MIYLKDKLALKIDLLLRKAGRDPLLCRKLLRQELLKIELSNGEAEWEEEYRAWLLHSFHGALDLNIEWAKTREDYEQCSEILRLIQDILPETELQKIEIQ